MTGKETTKLLGKAEIETAVKRLAHQIAEKNPDVSKLCLIGIQRRGVFLAQRIQKIIEELPACRQAGKIEIPLGIIDITLYRDDLTVIGPQPLVRQTKIDFDINSKIVILVDDVLFTGRTVRCALDEIMDFGRPKKIELVVLVDRGHRELPIRAGFVGKNIPTSPSQVVEVRLSELDSKDEAVILEKNE